VLRLRRRPVVEHTITTHGKHVLETTRWTRRKRLANGRKVDVTYADYRPYDND
jgi:hypothetical protein